MTKVFAKHVDYIPSTFHLTKMGCGKDIVHITNKKMTWVFYKTFLIKQRHGHSWVCPTEILNIDLFLQEKYKKRSSQ